MLRKIVHSLTILVLGLGAVQLPLTTPEQGPGTLRPGQWSLLAGETHHFAVDLAANHFLEVEIEQLRLDLSVSVLAPTGRELFEVDSPYNDRDSETVLLLAETSGTYRINIHGHQGNGAYQVDLMARRPATDIDRLRTAAARAYDRGELTRRHEKKKYAEALKHYTRAAELWRRSHDEVGEALARHRVGQVAMKLDDSEAALRAYNDAGRLAHSAGSPFRLADLRFGLARIHFLRAEHHLAIRWYGAAADLYADQDDVRRQARALNQIAWSHERLGQLHAARDACRQALDLGRNLGDLAWRGAMLNNLGEIDLRLGLPRAARERFHEALEIHREIGDEEGEAISLTSLGTVLRRLGKLEEARRHFAAAWRNQHRNQDRVRAINTLVGLGSTELELGHPAKAQRAMRSAIKIARDTGRRRAEALASIGLGEVLKADGEFEQARDVAQAAFTRLSRLNHLQGQATASFLMARSLRALGRLEKAREWFERAMEKMELVRDHTKPEPLRLAYFAFKHQYHEAYIDLLMELHQRHPGRGYDALALEASERSRARILLESLVVNEELPIPDLERLQGQLLDDDTLFIEIAMGSERSHLWAVDAKTITTHQLPGRSWLEPLARRAHQALGAGRSQSKRQRAHLDLAELSHALLDPIIDRLESRRLIIAVDGALQLVPFASLPDPRTSGEKLLLDSHEVVLAPSAAVALALRQRPRTWTKELAVIADPDFSGPEAEPALPPLSYSGQEAAAILSLVAPGQRLAALGTEADLDLFRGGALEHIRIVHISTHGVLDAERPERSFLALSHFNGEGHPQPGILEAREIAGLHLDADLVVLAACQTGQGRDARGEGLQSLGRAFLLAGAARVVVAYWPVDDRATALLMKKFYRELLENGQSPAAALRKAQLALRADQRFSAPWYWAGFAVQGDWGQE